jgi:diaminopimelate epimerase
MMPMSTPLMIPFRKMNGLGNEIVVVDLRQSDKVFTTAEAAQIAANKPSHFDQMMVLHRPRTAGTEASVRIYNTDGSEAGACGNGTRCIGWLAAQATGKTSLAFETQAGVLDVTVHGIDRISVDMGVPKFGWADIPLVEAFHDTRSVELQVGPIDKPLIHTPSVVNVGNPHAIFWVDRHDVVDLGRVGPMLEYHRLFPERANISLAIVVNRSEIKLQTWERGAGLTAACGTAACAAAVCAARRNFTGRSVTVHVPGGPLHIEWRADDHIIMTGPVEDEYVGEVAVG